MTIYKAWCRTNVPYESEDILIGVFSTRDLAQAAADKYLAWRQDQWLDQRSEVFVVPAKLDQITAHMF